MPKHPASQGTIGRVQIARQNNRASFLANVVCQRPRLEETMVYIVLEVLYRLRKSPGLLSGDPHGLEPVPGRQQVDVVKRDRSASELQNRA